METDERKNETGGSVPQGMHYPLQEDFISLREMIRMTLKHRRRIAIFTCAITIAAAAVFLAMPRKHGAEAVLQVVMPEAVADQVQDRQEHEANILSNLEYLKSSVVAARVVEALKSAGIELTVAELRNAARIERPSRTNLIRILAEARSEEDALAIASVWRSEYLKLLSENSVNRAILALQEHVNTLQKKWLENTGKAEEMRKYSEESEKGKIVTLSKGIEEGELWKRLVDGADAEQLKKLSDIHFKSQELDEGYLVFKELLLRAEQDAGSARRSLEFYNSVLDFLGQDGSQTAEGQKDPMIASYAKMLLEKRDIFAMGEAAVIEVRRGALTKTAVVFVAALFAACAAAFMFEWLRDSPVPR